MRESNKGTKRKEPIVDRSTVHAEEWNGEFTYFFIWRIEFTIFKGKIKLY